AVRRDPHAAGHRRGARSGYHRRRALLLALVAARRAGDHHPDRARPRPPSARASAGGVAVRRCPAPHGRGVGREHAPLTRRAAAVAATALNDSALELPPAGAAGRGARELERTLDGITR